MTARIGQRVNIYEDPVTRQKFEGVATIVLIGHLDDEDPQYQAMVSFDPEEVDYFRTFGEQDLIR